MTGDLEFTTPITNNEVINATNEATTTITDATKTSTAPAITATELATTSARPASTIDRDTNWHPPMREPLPRPDSDDAVPAARGALPC